MKTFLLHIILIFIICCLWLSCRDDRTMERVFFGNMDSLLEANPDSAYKLLIAKQKDVDSLSDKSVSMRQRIYLAEAENKLYLPMPSDSSFMDVVSYYDAHGTPNDRMLAYYLLGCIYRDKIDAPEALRNYLHAIECADTLSRDCNFTILFSVYGQMASLYKNQYLYEKAIWANSNYSKYAEKAGNEYEWIRGQELLIPLFESKGDTANVFSQTWKVYDLYINSGMEDKAVRVFPPLIYTYINRGEYEDAKKLMDLYEHKSGLFDNAGNISPRYSHYYLAKGLYYQGAGHLDSAEYYFRKLIENDHLLDGYNHLWSLFNQMADKDSISKYSRLLNIQLGNHLKSIQTDAISQVSSVHDGSKADKPTDMGSRHRKKSKFVLFMVFLFSLALLCFFYLVYRKKSNIKVGHPDGIDSQESTVNHTEIKSVEADTSSAECSSNEIDGLRSLSLSETVMTIKKNLPPFHISETDVQQELFFLKEQTMVKLPHFYIVITDDMYGLTQQEINLVLLSVLDFSTSESSLILNVSPSGISNMKSNVNYKLFSEKSAKTLKRNLKLLVKNAIKKPKEGNRQAE